MLSSWPQLCLKVLLYNVNVYCFCKVQLILLKCTAFICLSITREYLRKIYPVDFSSAVHGCEKKLLRPSTTFALPVCITKKQILTHKKYLLCYHHVLNSALKCFILESEKTRMCFVFCLRRDGKFEILKLVSRCLEHLDAGDRISKLFKKLN